MHFNIHSNTTKILGAFIVAAALFLAALSFSLHGMDLIVGNFDVLQHRANTRMQALNDLFGYGLLGGIAVRNKVFNPALEGPRQVVQASAKRFATDLHTVRGLTKSDNARALALLDDIGRRWAVVQDARLRVLDLVRRDKTDDAAVLLAKTEHPTWRSIRKDLGRLMGGQHQAIKKLEAEVVAQAVTTRRTSLFLGAIALVAGLLVAFMVMRSVAKGLRNTIEVLNDIAEGEGDLTRRLDASGKDEIAALGVAFNRFVGKIQNLVREVVGSTNRLAAATGQMSASTRQARESIQRQQGETDMVATAINEMSATVQEVARNTSEAAAVARSADDEARDGKTTVQGAIQSINALAAEIQDASQVVAELESETMEIGSVLDVIRGIAEQTNLLALNAAIEAARAGEQGRGFAVVADEVRTLASRTQKSTAEIQAMIERLQKKAGNSVSAMESSREKTLATVNQATATGDRLESITGRVAAISDMNTQIAGAAEEQSSVAEEINQNVVNIKQIAEETTASAEQLAEAGDALSGLAGELNGLVGHFKV